MLGQIPTDAGADLVTEGTTAVTEFWPVFTFMAAIGIGLTVYRKIRRG